MKKIITFIRHARSSWDNSSLGDMYRPLSLRGEQEAQHLKKMLPLLHFQPEKILCSEALRAKQTCKILVPKMYNSDIFSVDENIYPLLCVSNKNYDNNATLKYLKKVLNTYDNVCIIGHNEGLNEIIGYFIGEIVFEIPTCSFVRVQFNEKYTGELKQGSAKLDLFVHNKQFINSISKSPDTY